MAENLTAEELAEITGSESPAVQVKYLKQNGIRYIRGAKGKISTTWTAINHVLTGGEVGKAKRYDDSDLDFDQVNSL